MESIRTLLRQAADDWRSQRKALKWDGIWFSYESLAQRVEAVSSILVRRGIKPGDIVGQMAANSLDMVVNIFAVLRVGAVYCPLSPLFSLAEASYRINHSGMKAIFVDDASIDIVKQALKETESSVDILSVYQNEEYVQSVAIPDVSSDAPALLLYTSGSTGAPKGVMLSEKNLITNATQVIKRTMLSPEDRILHIMPLHHTNGINNNLIAPFLAGAQVVLGSRFYAPALFSVIEKERPTYFTGVPTMYWRLLNEQVPHGALDSLRFVRCGSAPLSPQLESQIEEHLGVPVITSYGLTEGTCTSTMTPLDNKVVGSVGTPLDGQEIRIIDPVDGRTLAPGQVGEVIIRGDNLMLGYYKNPEETEKTLVNGWLRTGDLARQDEDGYLFLTDRKKDIIVRGGENISPREIEEVLRVYPGIAEVAVVGVPSAEYGEEPFAFVVTEKQISEDVLISYTKKQLSRFKVPRHIISVSSLPRNALGKVERTKLIELATSEYSTKTIFGG